MYNLTNLLSLYFHVYDLCLLQTQKQTPLNARRTKSICNIKINRESINLTLIYINVKCKCDPIIL